MSVSVHMNGRKRSDMKAPLATHQVRLSEEDGEKALKDTDSAIDPKLSHMNRALVPDQSRRRFKEMRKKLDVMSEKRVERGGKRIYKSANVFMVGTLQIGDDSLELLGWKWGEDGKKLPADKQNQRVLRNVERVYADMMESVQAQPEIYGEVFSATLHMDEGSPHVDFMTDVLDVNEPDKLVAHYVQGVKGRKATKDRPAVKGTPKGEKLRTMQDRLMKYSKLPKETIDKFELYRGDSEKTKVDKVKTIRQNERNADARERALNARSESLSDLEGKVSEREKLVQERENKVNESEEMLVFRGAGLDARESLLDIKEVSLSLKETQIDSWSKVSTRLNSLITSIPTLPKEERVRKGRNLTAFFERLNGQTEEGSELVTGENIVNVSREIDEIAEDGKVTLSDDEIADLDDSKGMQL